VVNADGVDEGFSAEVVGGELGSHCHDRDREEIHGAIVLEATRILAIGDKQTKNAISPFAPPQ